MTYRTTTPKLHSVRFKNGGHLVPVHSNHKGAVRVDLDWAEVFITSYEDSPLTIAACYYILDMAQEKLSEL